MTNYHVKLQMFCDEQLTSFSAKFVGIDDKKEQITIRKSDNSLLVLYKGDVRYLHSEPMEGKR